MYLNENSFINPMRTGNFLKMMRGNPLEIVLQPKKFKGIFFNIKDIEKCINLDMDKYGDFHNIYSGSSP